MTSTSREEPEASSVALRLQLFGALALEIGGQPVGGLTRSARSLLALLVLRSPRSLDRNFLAATLWPETGETAARYNLRRRLTELRNALGPEAERIVSQGTKSVHLDLSGDVICDISIFDRAAGLATITAETEGDLQHAVDLYAQRGGTLLEGERGEWVYPEREARAEAYLTARERLAQWQSERGNTDGAIGQLRAILSAEPARETASRALMQTLRHHGRSAAALAEYQRLRDRLRAETAGAVPDTETTALYKQLLAESQNRTVSVAAATSPPDTATLPLDLPRQLSKLIGRDRDAMEVAALLHADKDRAPARLVTLTGSGGVGKTRLALAVAEAALPDFGDGACFVELASLADPKGLLPQIAAALRLPDKARRADAGLFERVVEVLRPRQILLLLDNCEHLSDEAAQLALALLRQCPRLTVLATSREPLGVPGEATWRVPGLAEESAVRLFAERAEQADFSFHLTESNIAAVRQIAVRLDGIPLAIEMAAARVRALPVGRIAARLDDVFRLLTTPGGDLLPRHKTLRATLDWSYDLLSPAERVLLARLSVFAGGWTLGAAETVGAGSGIESGDVFDLLASLIDKSLVHFTIGSDDEGRYRLLETIRQYGAEKLAASGETVSARDRHRDWCLALAEEANPHLFRGTAQTWNARLEAEHENFRAALAWCAANAAGNPADESGFKAALIGLRLSAALARFWLVRGYESEGYEHLQRALASWRAYSTRQTPSKVDERDEEADNALTEWKIAAAAALTSAGISANALGDSGGAQQLLEESLLLSREIGYKNGIASALGTLGTTAQNHGDFEDARRLNAESLALYRELNLPWQIASALNNLGTAAQSQGDYSSARAFHEESLVIRREIGDQNVIADSLNSLGIVAFRQGDHAAARALYEESLAVHRDGGNKRGQGNALNNLALIASDEGNYAAARVLLEESLIMKREVSDRQGVANGLNNLGTNSFYLGDLAAAQSLFEEAFRVRREIGDRFGIASSLGNIGEIASLRGDHSTAQLRHFESLAIYQEIGDKAGIALAQLNLGNVAIAKGNLVAARTFYEQGLDLYAQMARREGISNGLSRLALVTLREGDAARAVRLWASADALRLEVGLSQPPAEKAEEEALLEEARAALDDDEFKAIWDAGHALTWEQVAEEALKTP